MVQTEQPFNQFTDVSPDNSADLPLYTQRKVLTGSVYVGTAGDLAVVMADNSVQVFVAVAAGFLFPVAARRINATNTTASALVACYVV